MNDAQLTHVDSQGAARMVHVGEKPVTVRRAVAEGFVRCSTELVDKIRTNAVAKGDVLQVARFAGIQAAKRTDELIPLCHTIPLDAVGLEFEIKDNGIAIRAEARATWKRGVEMETLTAVALAALVVIDMGKAVDTAMVVERIRVIEKTGGKSGGCRAEGGPP